MGRRINLRVALGGLALIFASWLPTAATAGFIFDFEFGQQNGVPAPVVGTIEFTTSNSDDGGEVILDYVGEIHSYLDTDWVPDNPFRWDFDNDLTRPTFFGTLPRYDIATRWTIAPGGLFADAFTFSWDSGALPNLLFSRDGITFAAGSFTGPTEIPEPNLLSLFGAGLLVMSFGLRRKKYFG